ncbi:MAG: azurin [Rhodanobacter sp.]|nr:MAG: azurin [Rhodanobacter sp.]TAL93963.1 MAG: azurin [Rhodanobacter sp.]TAM42745.1 MAG: azurin [Rhodanobacter sp.]TAN23341.1 MAG: azurin [Rhodanobacter sp.]
MNSKMTVLALACVLALSACSDNSSSSTAPGATPSTTASAPMEAPAPAASTPAASPAAPPAATPATNEKPTAVVTDCATEIEGSDAMQYNVSSIVVPASCKDFKITLKHTGTMPVSAMGHDVVITEASDMKAVEADGATAGATDGYVKPDDSRVIAHTKLIGGGETTSVSFPVSKIQGDGPYEFFCSFPGHAALMHGSISVQ